MNNITDYTLELQFDPSSVEEIERVLDELLNRPIESEEDFDKFIADYNRTLDTIRTFIERAYINWSRDTSNPEYERDFNLVMEKIYPLIHEKITAIDRKIYESGFMHKLPEPMQRDIKVAIELFRPENIKLKQEEALIQKEYGKLNSTFQFEWEGKKLTLSEITNLLTSEDREVRKKAFLVMSKTIYEEYGEKIHDILDRLVDIRTKIARNAGFDNYRDYRWKELGREDYTPQDVEKYREAVKKHAKPAYENLLERVKDLLGIDEVRPWDTSANPFGHVKLFETQEELVELTKKILERIDPFFSQVLEYMAENDRLDLIARKGKMQGGYMYYSSDRRIPFIFMNASGSARDLMTLIHEMGHSINYMLSRHIEYPTLRMGPAEFSEVGSMALEFFAIEAMKGLIDDQLYKHIVYRQFTHALFLFIHIARIDKFQHWLYLNPEHTHGERESTWLEIDREFSPSNIVWDGLEKYRNVTWMKQGHIFSAPFYYIDYGIAQIGALTLWRIFRKDKEKALEMYKRGMSIGGTRVLPELFKEAGLEFRFDSQVLEPIVKEIMEKLNEIL